MNGKWGQDINTPRYSERELKNRQGWPIRWRAVKGDEWVYGLYLGPREGHERYNSVVRLYGLSQGYTGGASYVATNWIEFINVYDGNPITRGHIEKFMEAFRSVIGSSFAVANPE